MELLRSAQHYKKETGQKLLFGRPLFPRLGHTALSPFHSEENHGHIGEVDERPSSLMRFYDISTLDECCVMRPETGLAKQKLLDSRNQADRVTGTAAEVNHRIEEGAVEAHEVRGV